MGEPRRDRQTPTRSVDLPYTQTYGQEAIDLYNSTGRTAQEWQEIQMVLVQSRNSSWYNRSTVSYHSVFQGRCETYTALIEYNPFPSQ